MLFTVHNPKHRYSLIKNTWFPPHCEIWVHLTYRFALKVVATWVTRVVLPYLTVRRT